MPLKRSLPPAFTKRKGRKGSGQVRGGGGCAVQDPRILGGNAVLTCGLLHKWERALNHTNVKQLILTTNTQATKIKSEFLNHAYTVKGSQCIVTALHNCLN